MLKDSVAVVKNDHLSPDVKSDRTWEPGHERFNR